MAEVQRVILASGSAARRAMLSQAGLRFEAMPAAIDEDAIMKRLQEQAANPAAIALQLAKDKALAISAKNPAALVIGSDQVLVEGGRCFSKVASMSEAARVLQSLRGKTHELVSAVALVKAGDVIWDRVDTARLTMRDFSDAFLQDYLKTCGDRVLWSAGCYELEGMGVQLFEKIDGDYFTILGMPLLPLLAELRLRGALMS